MIYTVGHRESYERYFAEQGTPRKRGRDSGYPGGSVWRTAEEASACCEEGFAVYGVLADWDTDTAENALGMWRDLIPDAELVKLPPPVYLANCDINPETGNLRFIGNQGVKDE